jgi:hypothetical protein
VEGSGNGYLRTACDYVHLNPVRAKLLAVEERLLAYPWSSFPLYLAAREHRGSGQTVEKSARLPRQRPKRGLSTV